MSRNRLARAAGVALCCLLFAIASHAEIVVSPNAGLEIDLNGNGETATTQGINISFTCGTPNHLFLPGQPISLTAHITNTGETQDLQIGVRVLSELGCQLFALDDIRTIAKDKTVDESVTFGADERLPNDSYQVVVTANEVVGTTRFGVWNGPAAQRSTLFGISYSGPLAEDRTLTDLDLFKQAGIGWLRFPLNGWIPQGEAVSANAASYDKFIQSALDRQMTLLAAFTPQVSVDPAVNPVQAEKDYHESLLAAATRYAPQIKTWELLTVKPPLYPVGMKGIGYPELVKGREALRHFDKSLQAIIPLEHPMTANALEMFFYHMPQKDDVIGFHYNFLGRPENKDANPKPPIFELAQITSDGKQALKRSPTKWVTEYGFDATKDLPNAVYQAAVISRAIILNRNAGIARTFWRHDPSSHYDLPFTTSDGTPMPSLLAVRTTLEKLEGVISVTPVSASANGTNIFLLKYNGSKHEKAHYALVAWSDNEATRSGVVLKTPATKVTVTDLWGNTIELQPYNNTTIFQVDEFPRFVDLGTEGRVELRGAGGCAYFSSRRMVLTPGGANKIMFTLRNDPLLFSGNISGELRFHAWPIGTDVVTSAFALTPQSDHDAVLPLTIPENARSGKELCDVSVEIMMGSRRIGYLSLPVFYSSEVQPRER